MTQGEVINALGDSQTGEVTGRVLQRHLEQVLERVRSGEAQTVVSGRVPAALLSPVPEDVAALGLKTLTVSDVRQQLQAYVERVQGGEQFVVTLHGEPVAVLGPLPGGEPVVITMWNEAGGATKTTMVAELGDMLSRRMVQGRPARVLLVDLDPQRSLTRRMGLLDGAPCPAEQLTNTSFMVVSADLQPGEVPTPLMPTHLPNLRVLPAHTNLQTLDLMLSGDAEVMTYLGRVLRRLPFDYVLIDTPPSNGGLTRAGLVAADAVFVPVPTKIKGIENFENVSKVLGNCRMVNPNVRLGGFLPTAYDHRRVHDREIYAALTDVYSQLAPVGPVVRERLALYPEMVVGRTAIGAAQPNNPAAAELEAVLDFVLSQTASIRAAREVQA